MQARNSESEWTTDLRARFMFCRLEDRRRVDYKHTSSITSANDN